MKEYRTPKTIFAIVYSALILLTFAMVYGFYIFYNKPGMFWIFYLFTLIGMGYGWFLILRAPFKVYIHDNLNIEFVSVLKKIVIPIKSIKSVSTTSGGLGGEGVIYLLIKYNGHRIFLFCEGDFKQLKYDLLKYMKKK